MLQLSIGDLTVRHLHLVAGLRWHQRCGGKEGWQDAAQHQVGIGDGKVPPFSCTHEQHKKSFTAIPASQTRSSTTHKHDDAFTSSDNKGGSSVFAGVA